MIKELLDYNQRFVKQHAYEPYVTSKYPDKKLAIVTCMDTRLIELLPAALGIRNGDAKIIKNAGGVILHPYGSAVRSLLIAVYELGVEDILIIGHTDCGVQHMDSKQMLKRMEERGISRDVLDTIQDSGVDIHSWLSGFEDVYTSVRESMSLLKKHPLLPQDVQIHGFVMDSLTVRIGSGMNRRH